MNYNKVILAGNVASDPEMRKTPSDKSVCSFRLATNRYWTDQDSGEKQQETEFHNIVAWRRLAEIASQYLNKGSLVLIEGRLQTRSWEDQSGNTKYKTEVVARRMQMGPREAKGEQPMQKPSQQSQGQQAQNQDDDIPVIEEDQPADESNSNNDNNSNNNNDEEGEVDVEDIPF